MDLPSSLSRLVTSATMDTSPSRTRQLLWVAGELALAARELGWSPTEPADWFDDRFLGRYLAAAELGSFRRRTPSGTTTGSAASARVRRSCLAALAAAALGPGHAVPATGRTTPPLPGPDPRLVAPALDWWRVEASAPDALGITVRTAAIAHLVAELGLRTGEVLAMTVDDLDLANRQIRVTPAPQAARSARDATMRSVSPATGSLLRRWLPHRTTAISRTPHVRAVWVSLGGNHDDRRVLPAGLPLRARGLLRAHAASVERLNEALAGRPGWQPLSPALADLRRSARPDEPESPGDPSPGQGDDSPAS